jgi:hypothetical protein
MVVSLEATARRMRQLVPIANQDISPAPWLQVALVVCQVRSLVPMPPPSATAARVAVIPRWPMLPAVILAHQATSREQEQQFALGVLLVFSLLKKLQSRVVAAQGVPTVQVAQRNVQIVRLDHILVC